MFGIRTLVPGFARELARHPGEARAWNGMACTGLLSLRLRALVALAVARRVGGDYAHWAVTRLALQQGIGEEEAFLASLGTAHEPHERAILRYAVRAVEAVPEDLDREDELLRGVHEALAHAVLTCRMLAALAPERGTMPAQPGART